MIDSVLIGAQYPAGGTVTLVYNEVGIFLAVARAGSFVEAARRTGLPSSTVSRRIADLETRLGVQLVRRTTRRVSLTATGQAYADRCSILFDEIDEATRALDDRDEDGRLHGKLRVTVPMLAGAETFGPWLFEFASKHPRLRLELLVTNAFLDLAEDGIDLAFRLGPVPDTTDIVRRLWSVRYALCATPSVAAATPELSHPDDMSGLPLIVTPPAHSWSFVDDAEHSVVFRAPRDGATIVSDLLLGASAARHGLGIAYLPLGLVEDDLLTGRLQLVEIDGWRLPDRDMYAVYPPGRHLSARVRSAIDHVLAQRSTPDLSHRNVCLKIGRDVRDQWRARTAAGGAVEATDGVEVFGIAHQ